MTFLEPQCLFYSVQPCCCSFGKLYYDIENQFKKNLSGILRSNHGCFDFFISLSYEIMIEKLCA